MRRMLLASALVLPSLALLHGCAATGARFQALQAPKDGQALVYLYRPATFAGSGAFPTVHIGGKPVGPLKHGGYLVVTLPPGEHALTMPRSQWEWPYDATDIRLRVVGGQRHFFRLETVLQARGGSTYQHMATMRLVPEAQALAELEKLSESR